MQNTSTGSGAANKQRSDPKVLSKTGETLKLQQDLLTIKRTPLVTAIEITVFPFQPENLHYRIEQQDNNRNQQEKNLK